MIKRLINLWLQNREFRARYRNQVVRGLVEQIEWRLSLNHSTPDQKAAFNLAKQLSEAIK